MTALLPRLSRESAREILSRHLDATPEELRPVLPERPDGLTFSPVGGERVSEEELHALRTAVLELAYEHGFPGPSDRLGEFEGRCARLLHARLSITPHEASHEEVWSYLTCCWLLDVALWRFGSEADERRFLGNVNRNTFRRLWWRAEILGPDVDLALLGEDELVNLMERPTIAADRRLTRAIADEFLVRVSAGEAAERMLLMREVMKRVLRLTPFVAFLALSDNQVASLVSSNFDAAVLALLGTPAPAAKPEDASTPEPSLVVSRVDRDAVQTRAAPPATNGDAPERDIDIAVVGQVAIEIAKSTGQVTNATLREAAPITANEAREVFAALVKGGELVRRGLKRGTHYVLPEGSAPEGVDQALGKSPEARSTATPPRHSRKPTESALRRVLRRARD